MKRGILFLVTICFLSTVSIAQAPKSLWIKDTNGRSLDEAQCVAVDASGNVYVTGLFYSSTITFGSILLTNSNYSGKDFFLAKYDANGNVLWAKNAEGAGDDEANSVAVDASGNVYVTGYFNSDTLTIGTIKLIKIGGTNFFIAKYDSNGNVLWAKNTVGAFYDGASSVTVDNSGNVFAVGESQSWSSSSGTTGLVNRNDTDIFLVKYGSNGNVFWTKRANGIGDDYASSVSLDASGNIYTTGWFHNFNLSFGSISLVNHGLNDIFLAKYSANGSVLWAKSAGSTNEDMANSVFVDPSGSVYLAGSFRSDSISFGNFILTNASAGGFGREDIFLAKYNANGDVLWAKSVGGLNRDEAKSVFVDASGNVYLSGSFTSESISFGDFTITGEGNLSKDDMFLAKYDANGNVLWAQGMVSEAKEIVYSVAVDISDNIYLAGLYGLPIYFGDVEMISMCGSSVFLTKLDNTNGTNELNNLVKVDMYPIPSKTNLTIEALKMTEIEILNLQGKSIKTFPIKCNKITIDVSLLPKGLYILTVKTKNGITTDKFIIN